MHCAFFAHLYNKRLIVKVFFRNVGNFYTVRIIFAVDV